jgi:hypothetical protein
MRSKLAIGVIIGVAIGVLLSTVVVVLAGDLNPPSDPTDPASQMFTLEQLYQRLATGAEGTKMAAFTEPGDPPGSTMHTLDEIMAAAPAVDDANGAGVADVASGKTFWGLTSGAWGLQTGTASGGYPAPVPRTGQTTCWDSSGSPIDCAGTGQDGETQSGVAWPDPRFTDNLDGTVTDNLTGLIWLQNANCFGTQVWDDALAAANTLNDGECGLSDGSAEGDWRLPNVRELDSLIDYGQLDPALPGGHPFIGVQTTSYWSGSSFAGNLSTAWFVSLDSGIVNVGSKTDFSLVWPVRGGP